MAIERTGPSSDGDMMILSSALMYALNNLLASFVILSPVSVEERNKTWGDHLASPFKPAISYKIAFRCMTEKSVENPV